MFAPKTGSFYIEPKIGAMKTLRSSVYSPEQTFLRELFITQRKSLGLSQRALAERLGVIYSVVGKIETGDRRLDVIEFMEYCYALELNPQNVIKQLMTVVSR